MMKQKDLVLYSRSFNKFIVPISVKLKVDYSSTRNLTAVAFVRPTPTKSEFILMNNYGKIEEVSAGVF